MPDYLNLSRFEDLFDWAVQLLGIQSAALKCHHLTLVRLSQSIQHLQLPVEEEDAEVAKEEEDDEAPPVTTSKYIQL